VKAAHNRRAARECAHRARRADPDADVGAAGDHCLQRLAGALRPEGLEHDAVLFEDAGLLPERRHLVFPVVDLADRELEHVLGRGLRVDEHQRRG
jgi:hypothetical protein